MLWWGYTCLTHLDSRSSGSSVLNNDTQQDTSKAASRPILNNQKIEANCSSTSKLLNILTHAAIFAGFFSKHIL